MARYRGAVCKLCRREGMKLFLKGRRCLGDKCAMEKRAYPPGEHGKRRIKASEYRIQLREKQKVKRTYGLMEKQFHGYYELANRQKGITGENLLRVLETRFDNVIYRSGFATSRQEARQLVRHGGFIINGHRVNIPSYRLKLDDVFGINPKTKDQVRIDRAIEVNDGTAVPEWLEIDRKNISGKVRSLPERAHIDLNIQEQLIVELYSK